MRVAPRIGAIVLAIAAAVPLCARPASAFDEPAVVSAPLPAPDDRSDLHFVLTPGVWLPRLTGEVQYGDTPLSTSLDFDNDLDLRELEPTFTGDLFVRWHERWQAHVSGFHFATSGGGVYGRFSDFGSLELRPGDVFSSDFEITSFEVDLAYALFRPYEGPSAKLSLSPVLGFRYVDVEQREGVVGMAAQNAGGNWPSILGGLQFDLSWTPPPEQDWFFDRLSMELAVAIGPTLTGDSSYLWQLRTGINVYFTEHLAFLFGFRLLEMNVENQGYNLDGGLQGIFVAGTLRF